MTKEKDWPERRVSAAKRTNLREGDLTNWFVGYGKDRSCQFEGTWPDMMMFAAMVLSSENTEMAIEEYDMNEELYQPELRKITEQN